MPPTTYQSFLVYIKNPKISVPWAQKRTQKDIRCVSFHNVNLLNLIQLVKRLNFLLQTLRTLNSVKPLDNKIKNLNLANSVKFLFCLLYFCCFFTLLICSFVFVFMGVILYSPLKHIHDSFYDAAFFQK